MQLSQSPKAVLPPAKHINYSNESALAAATALRWRPRSRRSRWRTLCPQGPEGTAGNVRGIVADRAMSNAQQGPHEPPQPRHRWLEPYLIPCIFINGVVMIFSKRDIEVSYYGWAITIWPSMGKATSSSVTYGCIAALTSRTSASRAASSTWATWSAKGDPPLDGERGPRVRQKRTIRTSERMRTATKPAPVSRVLSSSVRPPNTKGFA